MPDYLTSEEYSKTLSSKKLPFDDVAEMIQRQISFHRSSWTYSKLEWEDVAQMILIRVWKKYELFDPNKAPLGGWVNTVIVNALKNILRDNLYKSARPCIQHGGCAFDTGGDMCSQTPSGLQCEECPIFRKWKDKKEAQYNITASVSIENHSQEVNSLPEDFINIDEKKKELDKRILKRLNTRLDKNMYRMLFIKHLTPQQVSDFLKNKEIERIKSIKGETFQVSRAPGYQLVLKFQIRVKEIARDIVEHEDIF